VWDALKLMVGSIAIVLYFVAILVLWNWFAQVYFEWMKAYS
jgi:hypothetical protein